MPTPTEIIAEALAKPVEAQTNAGRIRHHSLAEQISAAKFLAEDVSLEGKHRGLRFTKLVPPGAS